MPNLVANLCNSDLLVSYLLSITKEIGLFPGAGSVGTAYADIKTEAEMNRYENIAGRGDARKMALGMLNTRNLITVYWLLANQPETLFKGVQRHNANPRTKHP